MLCRNISASHPAIHDSDSHFLHVEGHNVSHKFKRPTTTIGRRRFTQYEVTDELYSEASEQSPPGTYVLEGRTESQTRVKIESLERRLRSNEKIRNQLEKDIEQWKRTAENAARELPRLEEDVSQLRRSELNYKELISTLESRLSVITDDSENTRNLLVNAERREREVCESIVSLFLSDRKDIEQFEFNSANVIALAKEQFCAFKSQTEELDMIKLQLDKAVKNLTNSQQHVFQLMEEISSQKQQDIIRTGINLEELEMTTEAAKKLKSDVMCISSQLDTQSHETELLQAELRLFKAKHREAEMGMRNAEIVYKALETEHKSFLETVGALLSIEQHDADFIKKTLRSNRIARNQKATRLPGSEKTAEMEENRIKLMKCEEQTKHAETRVIQQATQQRSAIFRARTAEEEVTVLSEKIQHMHNELEAAEFERQGLHKKIEPLEQGVLKMAEMLNISTAHVMDDVVKRVEQLAEYEEKLSRLFPDTRLPVDTSHNLRAKNVVRQTAFTSAKPIHSSGAEMLTIENLLLNKHHLKVHLSEHERKMRELEREKKETERLRSIIRNWDRSFPKTQEPTGNRAKTADIKSNTKSTKLSGANGFKASTKDKQVSSGESNKK